MWNPFKKLFSGKSESAVEPQVPAGSVESAQAPAALAPAPASSEPQAKPAAEKTDDELAQELNDVSPGLLSQAKTPQVRKMIVGLYRGMLADGVNVRKEKEVKEWLKKHPEAVSGGEARKVETVKRVEPKVGRNDPCSCGSGKKYKKCCGT